MPPNDYFERRRLQRTQAMDRISRLEKLGHSVSRKATVTLVGLVLGLAAALATGWLMHERSAELRSHDELTRRAIHHQIELLEQIVDELPRLRPTTLQARTFRSTQAFRRGSAEQCEWSASGGDQSASTCQFPFVEDLGDSPPLGTDIDPIDVRAFLRAELEHAARVVVVVRAGHDMTALTEKTKRKLDSNFNLAYRRAGTLEAFLRNDPELKAARQITWLRMSEGSPSNGADATRDRAPLLTVLSWHSSEEVNQ